MLLVRLVLTTEAIHSAAKYLSSNDITFNVHTNYLTTAFQASTFFFSVLSQDTLVSCHFPPDGHRKIPLSS